MSDSGNVETQNIDGGFIVGSTQTSPLPLDVIEV